MSNLKQFEGKKYLNLETFRKNGVAVRTPVWFVEKDGELLIYSEADAGKIKRVRNNPRVRIVPSSYRGNPAGEWIEGEARILPPDESLGADRLLSQKYWLKVLFDWSSKLKRTHRAYLAIRPR